jgi:hypothetical protein
MRTPGWYRSPLTEYGQGVAKRKLGLPEDASEVVFRQCVRGLQELKGLRVTGLVDEPTACALGDAAEWGSGPPTWWHEGMTIDGVRVAPELVRRLQGWLGFKPSGLINATTAWHLVVEYGVDVAVR